MSVIDSVASVVDDFDLAPELGALPVQRRGPRVKDVYGEYGPAAPITLSVRPWVAHNVVGRDLDQVPEANRNSEVVQFYTRDGSWPGAAKGFRVADQGSDADVVEYNGRNYEIVTVRNFSAQGRVWCALGALMETQV